MSFDAIGVNFSELKIMNIKRSLILLAILVVIFVGAVIAVYPNWLWFQESELRLRVLDHDRGKIRTCRGDLVFYDRHPGR